MRAACATRAGAGRGCARALALAALASVLLLPRSGEAKRRPPPAGVVLRYLGNEGFSIESGGRAVFIDVLQTVGSADRGDLPEEVYRRMLARRPPFARVPLVLVSHGHADHHVASSVGAFLKRHPEAQLVAVPEVIQTLGERPELPAIRSQLVEVHPRRGERVTFSSDGIRVEFLDLPHLASEIYPARVIAHVVEMGGKRILHVGDAEMTADQLQGLDLPSRQLDAAILPYWVLRQVEARSVVDRLVGARRVVAMRLPASGAREAEARIRERYPDAVILSRPLQAVRL